MLKNETGRKYPITRVHTSHGVRPSLLFSSTFDAIVLFLLIIYYNILRQSSSVPGADFYTARETHCHIVPF